MNPTAWWAWAVMWATAGFVGLAFAAGPQDRTLVLIFSVAGVVSMVASLSLRLRMLRLAGPLFALAAVTSMRPTESSFWSIILVVASVGAILLAWRWMAFLQRFHGEGLGKEAAGVIRFAAGETLFWGLIAVASTTTLLLLPRFVAFLAGSRWAISIDASSMMLMAWVAGAVLVMATAGVLIRSSRKGSMESTNGELR